VVLLDGDRLKTCQHDRPEGQHDALAAAGCDRVFTDTGSGKLARRPQLDTLLDSVRPGDVVVITKLDRLGRSVAHLVDLVAQLAERGVDLRVLHQGIDTTSPAGKPTFHMLAAIAEFERDLISERTREGLAPLTSQRAVVTTSHQ
jgi:DNA invertase Pin-like site-specific DNA recombinase